MAGLLRLALATVLLVGFFALVAHLGQIIDLLDRGHRRWRRRNAGPVAVGRPIETLAADARRLRRECALVPAGAPMARRRGVLLAYDGVLIDAGASLGVEHRLADLPLGPARDLERLRLEAGLEAAGFRLAA